MSGRHCYLCDGLVGSTGTRMWVETGRGAFGSVGMRGNLRVGGGSWQGLRTVCQACASQRGEQERRIDHWALFAVMVIGSLIVGAAGYPWQVVGVWGLVLAAVVWNRACHGSRWRIAREQRRAEQEYAQTIARLRTL